MTSKNTICLWYERAALDAAKCYAETFPDSAVGTIYRAPGDYPAGKQQKNGVLQYRILEKMPVAQERLHFSPQVSL